MQTLRQIGDALQKAETIAVLSHMRPDGDAIGSAVAVAQVLGKLGKEVTVINQDGVPAALEFLPGVSMVQRPIDLKAPLQVDMTVILDTASEQRAGDEVWAAFADRGVLVNIDHHISNPAYGDLNYIDAKAPATGEIVFDLIEEMGWPLDEVVRNNIWAGISTDTGSYRYPSTTAHTFEVGAELLQGGVDVGAISQSLYESYPLRRIYVLRDLLKELQISSEGKVASWKLRREVIDRYGVQPSDTEGLIDVIRSVDSVVVAVFFEELEDGKIRVSARSKTPAADVGEICGKFGGGGHQLAAGTRMGGSIDEAAAKFLNSVEQVING
ncbi:MAG: bifunctional oligoribonuclease/PAP phosphatase NrnA [Verrucomicrobiota bacterium]